jgi:hypothetical protein
MRRILLVLTVAAMMAVMMVATASPAFAGKFLSERFGSCGAKGVPEPSFGSDFVTGGQGETSLKFHECQNEPNNP